MFYSGLSQVKCPKCIYEERKEGMAKDAWRHDAGIIVTLSGRDAGREERLKACSLAFRFIRFTVYNTVLQR